MAALCFAEDARCINANEADLNSADDIDLVSIVRRFQSFITSRSDDRVCAVCGVVGLEGRGVCMDLKQFRAWIVRPHCQHDDSMAATLLRKIKSEGKEKQSSYLMWLDHLHLHSANDVRYILCSRGVHGGNVDVCSRCQTRTKDIRKLCAKYPDTDIYLSRLVKERLDPEDNVIIMPAPECSFAEWDPGKILQAGRHLSTLEKIALTEFVVAGNVHKVKNARDVIAAHRITGHTIVFPIDSLGCVASRTMTLPRTDIADAQRVMWSGPPSSYTVCHAAILNLHRLKMRYSDVVEARTCKKISKGK